MSNKRRPRRRADLGERQTVALWRQVPVPALLARESPMATAYQRDVLDGHLSVIVGPEPPGLHLSISHRTSNLQPGRLPTWDEVHDARYRFCPDELTMAMLLPPRVEYVNVHPTTFHLWETR